MLVNPDTGVERPGSLLSDSSLFWIGGPKPSPKPFLGGTCFSRQKDKCELSQRNFTGEIQALSFSCL